MEDMEEERERLVGIWDVKPILTFNDKFYVTKP